MEINDNANLSSDRTRTADMSGDLDTEVPIKLVSAESGDIPASQ